MAPNDDYSGRTAQLTSKYYILYIYSTNIGTEYFKHGIYSPFFPLQNAVCFIILTYLVPVSFTLYIQDELKFKNNNSCAKRLNNLHGTPRFTIFTALQLTSLHFTTRKYPSQYAPIYHFLVLHFTSRTTNTLHGTPPFTPFLALHYTSLHFNNHKYPSRYAPIYPLPVLHFTSLQEPQIPFTVHPDLPPSLHFTSLHQP